MKSLYEYLNGARRNMGDGQEYVDYLEAQYEKVLLDVAMKKHMKLSELRKTEDDEGRSLNDECDGEFYIEFLEKEINRLRDMLK